MTNTKRRFASPLSVLVFSTLATACGGSTAQSSTDGAPDASSTDASPPLDAQTGDDSATDGATAIDSGDGTPTRQACTGDFGAALNTEFGRLDGYIVSIVYVGQSAMTCNGDDSHVHLQVMMGGSIYDVAINVDGMSYAMDMPLPAPAWSEAWHDGLSNDYPSLGVHSTEFTMLGIPTTAANVEGALANANHISVYGTGYGPDGMHDTHYEGHMNDGMVVIDPQSPASHVLFFDFTGDTF